MSLSIYSGSWLGVTKITADGLSGSAPALQSVTSIENGRIRVVFTRAMDFTYPPMLDPGNYVYSWLDAFDGRTYWGSVFGCAQYDAQTVDLYVPSTRAALAHMKVVDGRDTEGTGLNQLASESDFAISQIAWGNWPDNAVALMGSYEGLEIYQLAQGWIGISTVALLQIEDDPMKRQFQSTEPMFIRFKPFLNKNDWSYIMGSDECKVFIRAPDGTLLESSVGGISTPSWDSGVKTWSLDLDPTVYTAHAHPSTNEWKIYAQSYLTGVPNPDGVPQWQSYFWGDYVNDITTGKTAAVSADGKLDTTLAKIGSPAGGSLEVAIGTPAGGSLAVALGTPAGASVSADVAAVKSDTASIKSTGEATAVNVAAIEADVTILKKVGTGRWRITPSNEFLIYDTDGVTVLYRFEVKDITGLPTSDNIYERVPL